MKLGSSEYYDLHYEYIHGVWFKSAADERNWQNGKQ